MCLVQYISLTKAHTTHYGKTEAAFNSVVVMFSMVLVHPYISWRALQKQQ